MLRRAACAAVPLFVLLSAPSLRAATVALEFSAPLTHLEEIPEPALTPGLSSGGTAWARVTFDNTNLAAGGVLDASLSWSGLTSEATMGHIHRIADPANCRTDDPTQCGTGGVLIALFNGNRPTADTLTVTGLFINGRQMTSLYAGLALDPPEAGALYFNVHTVNNGAGEIRGDITGAAVVPEPGTFATIGLALTTLVATRRRLVP